MRLFDVFIMGGVVMYPLLISSIVLLTVAIERMYYYSKSNVDLNKLMKAVKWNIKHGNFREARELTRKMRGPVAAVLSAGLSVTNLSRETLNSAMERRAVIETAKLERRLRTLRVITTIAPLLGLLGTVIGIIRNFNILAQTQGLAGPGALSVGIAEALLTTAVGLVIGIIAYIIYSICDATVDRFVRLMNHCGAELVDILIYRGESGESRTKKARES